MLTGRTGGAFSDAVESVRRRRPGKAKMERKAVMDDARLVWPFFIVPGLLPTTVSPSSDSRIVSFEGCFPWSNCLPLLRDKCRLFCNAEGWFEVALTAATFLGMVVACRIRVREELRSDGLGGEGQKELGSAAVEFGHGPVGERCDTKSLLLVTRA